MRVGLAILGLVVAVLLYFVVRESWSEEPERREEPSAEVEKPLVSEVEVLWKAPFALEFGKEGLSDQEELELIQLAFQDYLSYVKVGQRGPIGDNRDFVKALTGRNVQRVAPIPPDHPRISEKKELTDRSGIPFAIHPLSPTAIEVRAAGADRKLWTADDVVSLTASGHALKKQLLGE